MWAIDIVQQYNLFAQIMTANGNLRNVSFSSFWLKKKKKSSSLTAYLANSALDLLINSGHITNYITTMFF